MTREILFRGRRVFVPNEWVYGNLLTDFERHYDRDGKRITAIAYFEGFQKIAEIDPATVGQFTGLTDKNGVKIFEGDVLQFPRYYETPEMSSNPLETADVIFRDGIFTIGESESLYYEMMAYDGQMEVIGNIHENPELLGETT